MSDYVYDTFSGGAATPIDSHIGEVGATWVTSPTFGAGAPLPAFYVSGGVLRRVKYSESPSSSGGEMRCSPSGSNTLPASNLFIEVGYKLVALGDESLYIYCSNLGGSGSGYEVIASVDGYAGANVGARMDPTNLSSTLYAPAENVAGASRVLRLEFSGGQGRLILDGVTKRTANSSGIIGPLWIDLFNGGGSDSNFQIEHFRVGDLLAPAPPAPFWTDFAGSREIV